MIPFNVRRRTMAVAAAALLFACSRADNLWTQRLPAGGSTVTHSEVTGYWEGDVSMGPIRVRIEPAAMTIALKCDAAGDRVSQATAPIVFERKNEAAGSARMILQADLAGGDKDCGFRFNKGDAIDYALQVDNLEIAFAGASVARLSKLADLAH